MLNEMVWNASAPIQSSLTARMWYCGNGEKDHKRLTKCNFAALPMKSLLNRVPTCDGSGSKMGIVNERRCSPSRAMRLVRVHS